MSYGLKLFQQLDMIINWMKYMRVCSVIYIHEENLKNRKPYGLKLNMYLYENTKGKII